MPLPTSQRPTPGGPERRQNDGSELHVTDEELAALVRRACEAFGDEVIERALQIATVAAARSGGGTTALRAAFGRELQRILAAH
jgi:hypothetical protein